MVGISLELQNMTIQFTVIETNDKDKFLIYVHTIGKCLRKAILHLFSSSIEPLKLYGEGQYNLNSVKAVKVSEDFLGLDESIKECQNKESFEECKSGRYIEKVLNECKCLPFGIQHLYKVSN